MRSLSLIILLFAAFAGAQEDWWESGVFYQIYPRSFRDSNNDGIGDIRGIINSLDHLVDLGVTGFWLGPVFRTAMVDGGYDIINFRQVDPVFGTDQDLRDLFTRARALNLKIILDFVPNHTSDQHDWFSLSLNSTAGYQDFYIWEPCPLRDGGDRGWRNNWMSVYHTRAWTHHPARNSCYLHQYTPEQPDLNIRNERVQAAILEHVTFWLNQGVDGFRMNAVHLFETANFPYETVRDRTGDHTDRDNLEHANTMNRIESFRFIEHVREMLDNHTRATNNVTRVLMTDVAEFPESTQRWWRWYGESDARLGSHIPFSPLLFTNLDASSSAQAFHSEIQLMFDRVPVWGLPSSILGNHDTARVASRYGASLHEPLAILSMMMPGPAMIYYGEEIGMTDNRDITYEQSDDPIVRLTNETVFMRFSRDPARTPFQWDNTTFAGFTNSTSGTWLPVHPDYVHNNLRAQKEASISTYKLYQRLIEVRKESRTIQVGGYSVKVIGNTLALMRTLRYHPTVLVLIHFGTTTVGDFRFGDLLEDEYSGETMGTVLASTTNSNLPVGMRIGDNQHIFLARHHAVVIEVSSAGKVSVSVMLLAAALLKFLF